MKKEPVRTNRFFLLLSLWKEKEGRMADGGVSFLKEKRCYLTMTVPAAPVSASTALSKEVMMALRPALLFANLTAA